MYKRYYFELHFFGIFGSFNVYYTVCTFSRSTTVSGNVRQLSRIISVLVHQRTKDSSITFVNSFTLRYIQRSIQAKFSLSSFFYGRSFYSFLGVHYTKHNIKSRSQIPSFCLKGMLSISCEHFEVWNYGVGEKLAQKELFSNLWSGIALSF